MRNREDFLKISKLYRELQLLNTFSNCVQQNIIGSLILGAIVATSTGLGLLVKLNENMANVMVYGAMGMAFVDGITMLMILLGGMVSVCASSKIVLKQAKFLELSMVPKKNKMWVKRVWRSCDKLKIKFGDNNFLEELTPLRCLDFSVGLTVQLLLLSTNK